MASIALIKTNCSDFSYTTSTKEPKQMPEINLFADNNLFLHTHTQNIRRILIDSLRRDQRPIPAMPVFFSCACFV